MRHILRALSSGLFASVVQRRLILPFYLVDLLLAGLIAVPVWSALDSFARHSAMRQGPSRGVDWNFIFEFLGREGSHLQPLKLVAALIPLAFAIAILFLSAGAISSLLSGEKRDFGAFLNQAARYFSRFLRLALLSLPVLAILMGLCFLADLVQWIAFGRDPLEHIAYGFRYARLGLAFFGFALYSMILDYARIDMVATDENRARKSLYRAFKFVFMHLPKTLGLSIALAIFSLALIAAFVYAARFLGAGHWYIAVLLLLAEQGYILARILLKLVIYGSEVHLYIALSDV